MPREEWQANRFAVALLIDALVLREEYEARFGAGDVVRSDRLWRRKGQSGGITSARSRQSSDSSSPRFLLH